MIPAGGYGTRFLPATKAIPKELIPILNKPLIQYGVEEARDAGMRDIGIVISRGKHAIEDLFDRHFELEHRLDGYAKGEILEGIHDLIDQCRFSYTRQREIKGLGHAILTGEPLVEHQPFAVVLPDDLCVTKPGTPGVLAQMAKVFEKHQCTIIAIEEVPQAETHKYGIIDGDEIEPGLYQVKHMVEKPSPEEAPSNLAIIGRYILTPSIFNILRKTPPGKGREIQLTDALMALASQEKVLAYKFQGTRFDCGSLHGFVAATNYLYQRHYGS